MFPELNQTAGGLSVAFDTVRTVKKEPRAKGPVPTRSAPPTPAQAQVLAVLDRAGAPLTVAELAEATDQHGNTVREHLDALVDLGLVERVKADSAGRGRPSYLYAVVTPAIARPALVLIAALAGELRRTAPDPAVAARELGRSVQPEVLVERPSGWVAPTPYPADDGELSPLERHLADLGFAPEDGADDTMRLHTCPLVTVARADADVVCSFHAGLIDRWAADHDLGEFDLHPFAEPGACTITRTTQPRKA